MFCIVTDYFTETNGDLSTVIYISFKKQFCNHLEAEAEDREMVLTFLNFRSL